MLLMKAPATIQNPSPPGLKEFILSAGSIGTSHILLVGDADELSALGISSTMRLPDVGKNLTDNQIVNLPWTVNDTSTIENVYWRKRGLLAAAAPPLDDSLCSQYMTFRCVYPPGNKIERGQKNATADEGEISSFWMTTGSVYPLNGGR